MNRESILKEVGVTEKELLALQISMEWEKLKAKSFPKGHKVGEFDSPKFFAIIQLDDIKILQGVFEAAKSKKPLHRFVALGKSISSTCYICGEEVQWETNGVNLRAQSRCAYPNGIPLVFELNIPSGNMIVGNDFRPEFDHQLDHQRDFNVNTAMGCVKNTKAMEAIGCAHAFVGNSCPGVYETGKDTFIVASGGYDEKKDKAIEPEGKLVASICTDLWWYSIVDEREFKKRGCVDKYQFDRVAVRPGAYRFTHFYGTGQKFKEYDKVPSVYTKVEWVRTSD